MDQEATRRKMWLDLLDSERTARSAQHHITSRAEIFMAAGLDMERVLDALSISRATWYRRVEALRSWEAAQAAGGNDTVIPAPRVTGQPDVPGAVERIRTTAQADVVIPHAPVDPTAGGVTDSRTWCRWCGHRVISAPGGDSWVHHVSEGGARTDGIIAVPDCPGEVPWPSTEKWTGSRG